jgi:hypothetical protein
VRNESGLLKSETASIQYGGWPISSEIRLSSSNKSVAVQSLSVSSVGAVPFVGARSTPQFSRVLLEEPFGVNTGIVGTPPVFHESACGFEHPPVFTRVHAGLSIPQFSRVFPVSMRGDFEREIMISGYLQIWVVSGIFVGFLRVYTPHFSRVLLTATPCIVAVRGRSREELREHKVNVCTQLGVELSISRRCYGCRGSSGMTRRTEIHPLRERTSERNRR